MAGLKPLNGEVWLYVNPHDSCQLYNYFPVAGRMLENGAWVLYLHAGLQGNDFSAPPIQLPPTPYFRRNLSEEALARESFGQFFSPSPKQWEAILKHIPVILLEIAGFGEVLEIYQCHDILVVHDKIGSGHRVHYVARSLAKWEALEQTVKEITDRRA